MHEVSGHFFAQLVEVGSHLTVGDVPWFLPGVVGGTVADPSTAQSATLIEANDGFERVLLALLRGRRGAVASSRSEPMATVVVAGRSVGTWRQRLLHRFSCPLTGLSFYRLATWCALTGGLFS